MKERTTSWLIIFILLMTAVSAWCLCLRYRGISDFSDTLNYTAQAKYLANSREFNPARISWDDFVHGTGNINQTMVYPGQIFSLAVGCFSKLMGDDIEFWHILPFNFLWFLLGTLFCLLFLKKFLKGWELLLIGYLSVTNFYVMSATVTTLTDAWGWTALMLLLWVSALKRPHPIIQGVIFGISLFVRVHLAIFLLCFPILFYEKWNKTFLFRSGAFYFSTVCSYILVGLFLHFYVGPAPVPQTVAQYAQTKNIVFDYPDVASPSPTVSSHTPSSTSAVAYYYRQIFDALQSLKQHGIGWFTVGAYQTLGPMSWCFGPLFFVMLFSLCFQWKNPVLFRHTLFLIISFLLFYAAAYMLLKSAPPETMIAELKTLGRYFAYFVPSLLLVFWCFIRDELLSVHLKWNLFFEHRLGRFTRNAENTRLICTAVALCLIFPLCFFCWGYGAALLLKSSSVRQGPIVFNGDKILREQLKDFPPESMVLVTRGTIVQCLSSVRHVVDIPKSPEEFLQNKNNELLDAIVYFPANSIKMTDQEKQAWNSCLEQEMITDVKGNLFHKVCTHQGEGADSDVRRARNFTIFRRIHNSVEPLKDNTP